MCSELEHPSMTHPADSFQPSPGSENLAGVAWGRDPPLGWTRTGHLLVSQGHDFIGTKTTPMGNYAM